MKYSIILHETAISHLNEWKTSGQTKTLKKIYELVEELREHPTTGTGHPEQLKGRQSGLWSRRIDKKSRMIYSIEENCSHSYGAIAFGTLR